MLSDVSVQLKKSSPKDLTQVEEVKATSVVKKKHPSKLFKHDSSKGTASRHPSIQIHFVNTITTIPTPKTEAAPSSANKGNSNAGVTRPESNPPQNPLDLHDVYNIESMEDLEGDDTSTKSPGVLNHSLMEELEKGTMKLSISFGNRIEEGDPDVLKAVVTLGKEYIPNTYIDPESLMYNKIFDKNLDHEGFHFVGIARRTPIMVRNFIYNIDLTMVNDIESIINPTLTNLVLRKPFIIATGMTINETNGSILFTDGVSQVIFHDGNEEIHEYRPRLDENTRGMDVRGPCRIKRCDPNNLKIPCIIGHKHFYNVYIDTCLPMNVMSLFHYNNICRWGLVYKGKDVVGQDDDVQVFVGNMMFTMSFTIVDNIEDYINSRLSQVVFDAPFCEITSLAIDSENRIMTFTDGVKEVSFQTPYKS